MVSKPDYYLNLNLCDSQTQSLASCELLVWNFFKCFLTLKGFRSSFDIVQFSRSCAPHPLGWAARLLYLIRCRLSSTFLRFFRAAFQRRAPSKGARLYYHSTTRMSTPFFRFFLLFLQRAVLRFLLYYIQSTSGPEIFRFKIKKALALWEKVWYYIVCTCKRLLCVRSSVG